METNHAQTVEAKHPSVHPQLQDAVRILEESGVHYWVDSGTLVGILREGDVLGYDKDIDLSVWYDDSDQMEALVPKIKQLGYTFEVSEYDGYRYNYKFFPDSAQDFSMNIGIYKRYRDWAWRMAAYFTDNTSTQGSLGWYLKGAWRYPMRTTAQWACQRYGKHRVASRWPFGGVMKVGIWMIPIGLVDTTRRHAVTGLPIPARAEEYLTYRYGDWRSPVRDWLWYRDDRAVVKGTPGKVVGKGH